MQQLILYTRLGCHLCEDMEEALAALGAFYEFSLKRVDIDREPTLRAQYHTQVPVLTHVNGEEICRYFLEEEVLLKYLKPPLK
jgi:hypothetical protein